MTLLGGSLIVALCLSVACAACIGKYSQNADRTFVDYAVSW